MRGFLAIYTVYPSDRIRSYQTCLCHSHHTGVPEASEISFPAHGITGNEHGGNMLGSYFGVLVKERDALISKESHWLPPPPGMSQNEG